MDETREMRFFHGVTLGDVAMMSVCISVWVQSDRTASNMHDLKITRYKLACFSDYYFMSVKGTDVHAVQ